MVFLYTRGLDSPKYQHLQKRIWVFRALIEELTNIVERTVFRMWVTGLLLAKQSIKPSGAPRSLERCCFEQTMILRNALHRSLCYKPTTPLYHIP